MPRFVLLEHDHPELHWDFMLERSTVLSTWRLPAVPCGNSVATALKLADHRLAYLDYEGEVSGNRGRVTRTDAGLFEFVTDEPHLIEVGLHGNRLCGTARLCHDHGDAWRFEWVPVVA